MIDSWSGSGGAAALKVFEGKGASERHLEWRRHRETDAATDVTVKPRCDLLHTHSHTHTHTHLMVFLIMSINDSGVSSLPVFNRPTLADMFPSSITTFVDSRKTEKDHEGLWESKTTLMRL